MKNQLVRLLAVAGLFSTLAVGAFAQAVAPTSWEVSGEFNNLSNPSYVWTYGRKPAMPCTGTFTAFIISSSQDSGNTKGWIAGKKRPYLGVYQNKKTVPNTGATGVVWPPRGLALHPGGLGECAVVRFTAPVAGTYDVTGHFYGLDGNGSGTDVNVYVMSNNILLGNALVTANPSVPYSFSFTGIPLAANDTVDFAVEYDGNYTYDTTGLHAVIELR